MTSESEVTTAAAKREFNYWWWGLGTIFGSLSLISLVQRMFEIGLAPLPQMVLDYYRPLFAPIRSFVNWTMPFDVPAWYTDFYVLSFLSIQVSIRAMYAKRFMRPVGVAGVIASVCGLAVSGIMSFLLIGVGLFALYALVYVLSCFGLNTIGSNWHGSIYPAEARHYVVSIGMLVAAAIAFFAWNYQAG